MGAIFPVEGLNLRRGAGEAKASPSPTWDAG